MSKTPTEILEQAYNLTQKQAEDPLLWYPISDPKMALQQNEHLKAQLRLLHAIIEQEAGMLWFMSRIRRPKPNSQTNTG